MLRLTMPYKFHVPQNTYEQGHIKYVVIYQYFSFLWNWPFNFADDIYDILDKNDAFCRRPYGNFSRWQILASFILDSLGAESDISFKFP